MPTYTTSTPLVSVPYVNKLVRWGGFVWGSGWRWGSHEPYLKFYILRKIGQAQKDTKYFIYDNQKYAISPFVAIDPFGKKNTSYLLIQHDYFDYYNRFLDIPYSASLGDSIVRVTFTHSTPVVTPDNYVISIKATASSTYTKVAFTEYISGVSTYVVDFPSFITGGIDVKVETTGENGTIASDVDSVTITSTIPYIEDIRAYTDVSNIVWLTGTYTTGTDGFRVYQGDDFGEIDYSSHILESTGSGTFDVSTGVDLDLINDAVTFGIRNILSSVDDGNRHVKICMLARQTDFVDEAKQPSNLVLEQTSKDNLKIKFDESFSPRVTEYEIYGDYTGAHTPTTLIDTVSTGKPTTFFVEYNHDLSALSAALHNVSIGVRTTNEYGDQSAFLWGDISFDRRDIVAPTITSIEVL